MKLKKLNTILAAGVLGSAMTIYCVGGFVAERLPWSQGPQTEQAQSSQAANAQAPIVFGSKTPFSSEGKQVVTIPWQSQFGQIPEKATLQKWTEGDRTFYRISGPINPQYGDIAAGKHQDWGKFFGCEVFFPRGGGSYDQWVINPNGSMVYEYGGASNRITGGSNFSGQSRLPDSRYRGSIKGGRVEVTFWCNSQDPPANIVFNYNDLNAKTLHWVTTGKHESDSVWNHHWASDWSYP